MPTTRSRDDDEQAGNAGDGSSGGAGAAGADDAGAGGADEQPKESKSKLRARRAHLIKTLSTQVPDLVDETSFNEWKESMLDIKYGQEWEEHLLSMASEWDPAAPEDEDEETSRRVAFGVLANTSTKFRFLRMNVAVGDATGMWQAIINYFERPTVGNLIAKQADFFTNTMVGTSMNVMQFADHVDKQAAVLRKIGGSVSEIQKVTVFLKGLPQSYESKTDRLLEESSAALTYTDVVRSVYDWAATKGIFSNASTTSKAENTFLGDAATSIDPRKVPCPYHVVGKCRHSSDPTSCPFSHKRAEQLRPGKQNYTKLNCFKCGEMGHKKADCPKLAQAANYNECDSGDDDESKHDGIEYAYVNTTQPDTFLKSGEQVAPQADLRFGNDESSDESSNFEGNSQFYKDIPDGESPIQLVDKDIFDRIDNIVAYNKTGKARRLDWIVEDGTTTHTTHDEGDFLKGSVEKCWVKVKTGGGTKVATKRGTVLIRCNTTRKKVLLSKVLFMPWCPKKLISNTLLNEKGCRTASDKRGKTIWGEDGKPILVGHMAYLLYHFDLDVLHQGQDGDTQNTFALEASTSTSMLQRIAEAHRVLGHKNMRYVRRALGLPDSVHNPPCTTCDVTKSTQKKLTSDRVKRASLPLWRIHADFGFMHKLVFVLFVDDKSRKSWVAFLKKKSFWLEAFKQLKRQLENEKQPLKIAKFSTDSEPVFINNLEAMSYFKGVGIEQEKSPPYRHDGNGVVERKMRSIGEGARAMMAYGAAPEEEAKWAIRHSVVCENSMPTKANKAMASPNSTWEGVHIPVSSRLLNAGPLFCLAFPLIYGEERRKHEDRARPAIYIGVDNNSSYIVRDWHTRAVHHSADVKFYPNFMPYRQASPDRALDARIAGASNIMFDNATIIAPAVPQDEFRPPELRRLPQAPQIEEPALEEAPVANRLRNAAQRPMSTAAVESVANQVNFNETNKQQTALTKLLESSKSWQMAWDDGSDKIKAKIKMLSQQGIIDDSPDPKNREEAMESEDAPLWLQAEAEELASHRQHKTGVIMERRPDMKVLKSRPVYKKKRDAHNLVYRYKVRFTVAAYKHMMKQGINFEEKYASTSRWTTIIIVITIAVRKGWPVWLIDIKTFFLYGDLGKDELVLMEPLPGMVAPSEIHKYVYQLLKAIYGLPQASYHAQRKLKKSLVDGGFTQSSFDSCLFILDKPDKTFYLTTHVDDQVATGTEEGYKHAEATLKKVFEISIVKDPQLIMGVAMERDYENSKAKLSQKHYIDSMVEEFGFSDCNKVDTLMSEGCLQHIRQRLSERCGAQLEGCESELQSKLGKLIWLFKTRPDINFATCLMTRFTQSAGQEEVRLVDRIIKYLKSTSGRGIVIDGSGPCELTSFTDSDLGGDPATEKSTSGNYIQLGNSTIFFMSRLQRKLADSVGKAETHAAHELCRQLIWVMGVLIEMGVPVKVPAIVYADNSGIISQSKHALDHKSSKHYRLPQAMIRELKEANYVEFRKVDTKFNGADALTKPLGPQLFWRHMAKIMGEQ